MSSIMKFSKFAFKNLFSKPATEKYPFEERKFADRYRGRVNINIDECLMCGLCAKKCPSGAITVNKETHTWSIERMGCVQCSNCVNSCPKKCLSMEQHYTQPSDEKTVDSYVQPVKEAEVPKGGKPQADKDACVYCTLCAKNCPVNALTVDRAEKVWQVNKDVCIGCGLCASKCPKKCIEMK